MGNRETFLSDQELLVELRSGKEEVFKFIFNRYWKRLYNYAFNIYNDDDVCEDIVQEIFVNLWEKSGEVEILNLEAYLYRSVKYRIVNHIRDLKFTEIQEEILKKIPYPSNSGSTMEYEEFETEIFNFIKMLPARCREIFMLSRFDNYTNSEIAKKLNISIRTVEKQISNALSFFKSKINNSHFTVIVTFMLLHS